MLFKRVLSSALKNQKSFRNPNPYWSRRKHCNRPPICTALLQICITVPSWLLSLEERESQQYTSHLYCNTPPIWTAMRLPFVQQDSWESTGGWGHRKVSERMLLKSLWHGLLEGERPAGRKCPFWGVWPPLRMFYGHPGTHRLVDWTFIKRGSMFTSPPGPGGRTKSRNDNFKRFILRKNRF